MSSKVFLKSAPSVTDVVQGLALPFRAFRVIFATPKLLGLSILSALVTAATLVGLVWFWWNRSFAWSEALVGTGSWKTAVSVVVALLLFSLAFFVSALTVPNLILAPLQDPLSEAVEEWCGDFTPPPFSLKRTLEGTFYSLRHTVVRLALQVMGMALLLPLNLVPGIGSIAWAVAGTTWSLLGLALEHLSNPMARHFYPFRAVLGVVRRRLALAFGFGAALYVLLWVPVLNFFVMPLAVVSGTLLFRALRTSGDLGAPPSSP